MSDASHTFICFSSKDAAVAREVVEALEADGLKCWISSRDVPTGQNYQETIVAALERANSLVFLFSEASAGSGEIKKELSLAGGMNTPVFPLRLSPILPKGALRYELATRQWVDIFPDHGPALRKLVETIRKALNAAPEPGRESSGPDAASVSPAQARKPLGTSALALGREDAEAVRVLLARHVGPIAKVLVQKASIEAQTAADFCEQLAAHVSTSSDRAAFLQAARARLSVKP